MIYEWIVNNLSRDGVVVEAGMYNGQDTEFFCRYFWYGKVYGFEPVASIFEQARSRVGHYQNAVLSQKGLDETTGTKTMFFSDRFGSDWGSSSILKPKDHLGFHPEITFNKSIEIETVNLDDWSAQNNIDKIDLMWLDAQGSEPVILAASPKTLANTRYLYSEVSLIETYDGVMMYPEFKVFLEKNNFEMVYEDLPWKDMGNVLYRNKNLT